MNENLPQSADIYEQLGVLKDMPGITIHQHFLKLVMRLLDEMALHKGEAYEKYLPRLQSLWFAHDILTDPHTRTDYDLRTLGIATGEHEIIDESLSLLPGSVQQSSPAPPWRIGELLQAAGLLEKAELEIASDMHKAMPEMQFGSFLSKQGYIGEKELQAALIGQLLLRQGHITLSQFCAAMAQMAETGKDIKEILLESGYISKPMFEKLDS